MLHREKAGEGRARFATGQTIRARRQELGLTLQALADKSGLSPAFISQVERNQASASMVSLMNLARALDVSVTTFMELPLGEAPIRRHADPQHIEIESPVQYIQLSAGMKFQQMDAVLMVIPPGHVFPVDQREGEDFLYVLEGELYTELGSLKATLRAGDSSHFNSRTPHTARNLTDREVVLLYVGTPSVFKAEG